MTACTDPNRAYSFNAASSCSFVYIQSSPFCGVQLSVRTPDPGQFQAAVQKHGVQRLLLVERVGFGLAQRSAFCCLEAVQQFPVTVQQRPEFFLPLRKAGDRKSTRLNSSHVSISYAVFCLKKKTR